MRNNRYLYRSILLTLLIFLAVPYVFDILCEVFSPERGTVWSQLSLYGPLAAGMAGYAVIRRLCPSNVHWLETFMHELTHTAVSLLFGRQIQQFKVGLSGGYVCAAYRRKLGDSAVTLSPYFLPVAVYPLLILRCIVTPAYIWLPDVLTGFVLCMHLFCFATQTSSAQPDLRQYPLPYSYLYIVLGWLVNFGIIWVCFLEGHNVLSSVWQLVFGMWNNLVGIFA